MKRTLVLMVSIPLIWVFFNVLSKGAVLTPGNLVNLFKYLTVVGVLSIGMTLIIASGFIDLSVGSLLGFLGAVNAKLLLEGHALGISIVATLVLAFILGGLHGYWVGRWKIPAFIATLSGLLAYMGAKQYLANPVISIREPVLVALGQGTLSPTFGWVLFALAVAIFALIRWRNWKASPLRLFFELGSFLGIGLCIVLVSNADRGLPLCTVLMVMVALAAHFFITQTKYGRHLYALGSNREAAHYSGLPLTQLTVLVFALMGVFSALAGIVATSQLMAAAADIGDYQELYAIAACVIGGASLQGGTGNVWMSLLGALLMASILNGMEQVGISSPIQKIILGIILVVAVGIDQQINEKT